MNTEVSSYMFGSVLSLSRSDAVLSVILSAAVLALFIAFYPRIFAVTFDEDFSRATGTKTELFNTLIAVLTAVTVVLGMRMMGALLISSLIIYLCAFVAFFKHFIQLYLRKRQEKLEAEAVKGGQEL
jgi:zinc transport system permease protein